MGGQRIDDHSFWAGGKSKGSVFPEGAKVKEMKEGEGCGDLRRYEDSAAEIKDFQDMSARKAESHAMRPNHRQ